MGCFSVPSNELDILRDVSIKLKTAGIDFMLSGSLAMGYYAQPRMTRDIDIVVHLTRASAVILFDLFKNDYYISMDAIDGAFKNESMFNIIHQQAVIKVDFIIRKNTAYRIIEFERRKEITLRDFQTCICSVEDLILSKLEWMKDTDSQIQKDDINRLLKTEIDLKYLELWVSRLGLLEQYSRIKNG
jgi:hypothetical protein